MYGASTWMLTDKVFPQTLSIDYYAKDISTAIQAFLFLVVAFVAIYRPKRMPKQMFTLFPMVCLPIGTLILYMGICSHSAQCAIIGLCLTFTAQIALVVLIGCALLKLNKRLICVWVLVGILLSYLLRFPLSLLDGLGALVFYALLQMAAIALLWKMSASILDSSYRNEAPAKTALTNPFSFLPLNHRAFLCLLLFQIAYGYAISFGESGYSSSLSVVGIIPLLIFVIYYVLRKQVISVDVIFSIAVLFVIAGYMFVPAAEILGYSLAGNLLEAGNTCFSVVFWVVLGSLAERNPRGALVLYAWSGFLLCMGDVIGGLLGRAANSMVPTSTGTSIIVTCLIVVGYISYTLVYLSYKHFTFSATIEHLEASPLVSSSSDAKNEPMDAAITTITSEYNLTPREIEVFKLLARGRSGTYIQHELVVSYNTVKTHVAHIYNKLGIHNHQQLINFVEEKCRKISAQQK